MKINKTIHAFKDKQTKEIVVEQIVKDANGTPIKTEISRKDTTESLLLKSNLFTAEQKELLLQLLGFKEIKKWTSNLKI